MGNNADEADADEIIDMASKASLADQEKQVQENVHLQIKRFCTSMDEILLPDGKTKNQPIESSEQSNSASRRSGLSFAVGLNSSPTNHPGEYLFDNFVFLFQKILPWFSIVLGLASARL